ncbi:MAG: hypothetical protein RRY12_03385 [Cloacibacillus sp.]
MPALLLISASGTAQRRLLEETTSALEKKGYSAAGRQEGGEWNSLLSDNMTGGLFDEERYIVVESAPLLGAMPEKLSGMIEPEASVVIVLVYDGDAKNSAAKFIPKPALAKCQMLKAAEFPRWPRERQAWTMALAKELHVALAPDGAAMIVELLEDPEEIRAQLKSLRLLKKGGAASAADVERLCLDDGSRNLLRLLDGLCTGDFVGVMKSLRSMARTDDLIPLLAPLHNRMRLAWYAGVGKEAPLFAQALGAKDYAWRMARQADQRYGHAALTKFITAIIRINIEERSGAGAGWHGLETAVIELLSAPPARGRN